MTAISFDATHILPEDIYSELRAKVAEAVAHVATLTHAHILERAHTELNTRAPIYSKALKAPKRISDFQYEIVIDKEGEWIEKGLPSNFDMLPGLLRSKSAKTGKKGRYVIIPFDHATAKQTPQQAHLSKAISSHIKQHGLGKPISKNTWKMNIHATPFRGKMMSSEGRSYLKSTMIYKKNNGNADVKTFRTASESQKGVKWIHPGIKPFNGLTEGAQWAEKTLQQILKELGIS